MLARQTRRAQLAELALYGALALWLHGRGVSAIACMLLPFALMAGVRIAIVCAMFALAWIHRSDRAPAQRIGPAAAVAMIARECMAFLAMNLVRIPWEHRLLRPDPPPGAQPPAMPVVLVHGYFVNRGCWHPLVAALESAGVGPVHAPNCRSHFASIERFEEDLHAAIERIATGQRVAIVAHSMGGLAARLYLARRGSDRVARLVTIGSPHRGTRLAAWGLGENARQMRPGSAFLAALEAHEARSAKPPTVAIRSIHDNMIQPQDSGRLAWARNVEVRGLGHISQFADPEVARCVIEALREP